MSKWHINDFDPRHDFWFHPWNVTWIKVQFFHQNVIRKSTKLGLRWSWSFTFQHDIVTTIGRKFGIVEKAGRTHGTGKTGYHSSLLCFWYFHVNDRVYVPGSWILDRRCLEIPVVFFVWESKADVVKEGEDVRKRKGKKSKTVLVRKKKWFPPQIQLLSGRFSFR